MVHGLCSNQVSSSTNQGKGLPCCFLPMPCHFISEFVTLSLQRPRMNRVFEAAAPPQPAFSSRLHVFK